MSGQGVYILKLQNVLWLLGIILTWGCSIPEEFPSLNLGVTGPTDVVSYEQDNKTYFYVLNSDFDRHYDQGSLLVVDDAGNKLAAIKVPRLGRSLAIAGHDLIATFDRADDDTPMRVVLYDLSQDPLSPMKVKEWNSDDENLQMDCLPLKATMRQDYRHFIVSCTGGKIYLGTLNTPRSESTLKLVRDYKLSRDRIYGAIYNAIYIDPLREVMLGFVADLGLQTTSDRLSEDTKSYDEKTGQAQDEANEIPDDLENTQFKRRNTSGQRKLYKYIVYNIGAERDKGFPYVEDVEQNKEIIQQEMRWLYFTLTNFDGTPDTEAGFTDLTQKIYRTNFWHAQEDPLDDNAFYLSHRGKSSDANKWANNIIRVEIIGDLTNLQDNPPVAQLLHFRRVYGFKGELDPEHHFPSDFVVEQVKGRQVLVVNHFKDLVSFRSKAYFSIAAKLLDGGFWRDELSSTLSQNSFFRIALAQSGKGLSCSFYGNALIPLEIEPGVAIKQGWGDITRIE